MHRIVVVDGNIFHKKMKRFPIDAHQDSSSHKKTKIIPTSSERQQQQQQQNDEKIPNFKQEVLSILAKLNMDEVGLIMEFLCTGEILMMSLCSKRWYESICSIVKEKFPTYVIHDHDNSHGWTLTAALRGAKSISISSHESVEQVSQVVNEIAEQGYSLSSFTKRFNCVSMDPTTLYDILNTRIQQRRDENAATTNVKTVVLKFEDDLEKKSLYDEDENEDVSFKDIEIREIPIGFSLKELTLNEMSLDRSTLYRILSKCCALEKLDLLCLEPVYYSVGGDRGRGRGKGGFKRGKVLCIEDEEDEFYNEQEGLVYVPVLESLKSLTSDSIFDYDAGEKFMIDILKLCPNLEELHYIYQYPVNDWFLSHLAKMCPKLKNIKISAYDGATPIELEVTDEGIYEFLKALPQLEHVDFYPCCNFLGELFKKIGEFSQLKHFRVIREGYNSGLVTMADDVHFGGGMLPKLEYIGVGRCNNFNTNEELDKFFTTLRSIAPHLKDFGIIFDTDRKLMNGKQIIELFSDSLTHLNLEKASAELISNLPKNLSTLGLMIDNEFASQNMLSLLQPNHGLKRLSLIFTQPISLETFQNMIEKLAVHIYPCVTHLELLDVVDRSVSVGGHNFKGIDNYLDCMFEKILRNPKAWHDLRYVDGVAFSTITRLLKVRPTIRFNLDESEKHIVLEDERSNFYYQWLVLDQPFESWSQ